MKNLYNIYEGVLDDDFIDGFNEGIIKDTLETATTLPPVHQALEAIATELNQHTGKDYQKVYDNWKEGKQKKLFSMISSKNGSYMLCYTIGNTMYQFGFRYKIGSKTDGRTLFTKPRVNIDFLLDFTGAKTWVDGNNGEYMIRHWPWTPKFKWLSDWIYQSYKKS